MTRKHPENDNPNVQDVRELGMSVPLQRYLQKNGNTEMKSAFNSDCCVTDRVKSPLDSNPNVLKYMS